MKAIIIGCGRLGSAIALELYRKGNEVTVIDKDPDSFALLGSEFNGNTIVGIGFDKEVMEEAESSSRMPSSVPPTPMKSTFLPERSPRISSWSLLLSPGSMIRERQRFSKASASRRFPLPAMVSTEPSNFSATTRWIPSLFSAPREIRNSSVSTPRPTSKEPWPRSFQGGRIRSHRHRPRQDVLLAFSRGNHPDGRYPLLRRRHRQEAEAEGPSWHLGGKGNESHHHRRRTGRHVHGRSARKEQVRIRHHRGESRKGKETQGKVRR